MVLHVTGAKCTFVSQLVVPLSWSKSMTFLKELWPGFEARIGHGLIASSGGMKGIMCQFAVEPILWEHGRPKQHDRILKD